MARLIFLIGLLLFVTSLLSAQDRTSPKTAVTQSVANSALLRAEGQSIRINGIAAPSTMAYGGAAVLFHFPNSHAFLPRLVPFSEQNSPSRLTWPACWAHNFAIHTAATL
jgi:hypothetical protein